MDWMGILIAAFLLLGMLGCGDRSVTWTPPTSYVDGSPLNPETEIKWYEVAISAQREIGEESIVACVNGGTASSFDLTSFRDGEQWVTVRCVTMDNVPSEFAPPVLWKGLAWN